MYHHFLSWVHKFSLVLSFQIPVVLALCFLLTPTFRKRMLPLVSLVLGTSGAWISWSVIYFWISIVKLCFLRRFFSWHMVFEIPTSSATSQMVKWQLEWNTFQIFWMFSSFLNVEGRPECSVPSIEIWLSLKCTCHSWVCVLLRALSPNVCFNVLKVSEKVFLNFETKFHTNMLLILNPWKICPANKISVLSNRHSTMTKQIRMIWFVALT